MSDKMVDQIMEEATGDVTLDTFLDRHPSTMKFPEDYVKLSEVLRKQRAMFIDAQEKKKAKKAGIEEPEDGTD